MRALDIADCINETCPWSGKPVQADSLAEYGGRVVGKTVRIGIPKSRKFNRCGRIRT